MSVKERKKVFAKTGDIFECEVKRFAEGKRDLLVVVELDTGEEAKLPMSELNATLESLRLPKGDREGTHLTVRVIDAYTDSFRQRRYILASERAVDERVFDQYVDRNTPESEWSPSNVPEEVLDEARLHASRNRIIRGVVVGDAPGGKSVDIGGFVAILLREDYYVKSPHSLRKGVTVRVRYKQISASGITLTRKGQS